MGGKEREIVELFHLKVSIHLITIYKVMLAMAELLRPNSGGLNLYLGPK